MVVGGSYRDGAENVQTSTLGNRVLDAAFAKIEENRLHVLVRVKLLNVAHRQVQVLAVDVRAEGGEDEPEPGAAGLLAAVVSGVRRDEVVDEVRVVFFGVVAQLLHVSAAWMAVVVVLFVRGVFVAGVGLLVDRFLFRGKVGSSSTCLG